MVWPSNPDGSIHLHARSVEFLHRWRKKVSLLKQIAQEALWMHFLKKFRHILQSVNLTGLLMFASESMFPSSTFPESPLILLMPMRASCSAKAGQKPASLPPIPWAWWNGPSAINKFQLTGIDAVHDLCHLAGMDQVFTSSGSGRSGGTLFKAFSHRWRGRQPFNERIHLRLPLCISSVYPCSCISSTSILSMTIFMISGNHLYLIFLSGLMVYWIFKIALIRILGMIFRTSQQTDDTCWIHWSWSSCRDYPFPVPCLAVYLNH